MLIILTVKEDFFAITLFPLFKQWVETPDVVVLKSLVNLIQLYFFTQTNPSQWNEFLKYVLTLPKALTILLILFEKVNNSLL